MCELLVSILSRGAAAWTACNMLLKDASLRVTSVKASASGPQKIAIDTVGYRDSRFQSS